MDNRMFEQSVVYILCVFVCIFLLRQLFRPLIIIWKGREMSVIHCTLVPLFACTQNIAFYAHTYAYTV